MATKMTLEGAMRYAAALDAGEARDAVLYHLEKMDYPRALMACGDSVLDGLRRETDLSVDELRRRMRTCAQLEKLEKMIASLAKDAREARRLGQGGLPRPVWPPRRRSTDGINDTAV